MYYSNYYFSINDKETKEMTSKVAFAVFCRLRDTLSRLYFIGELARYT